ncbi:MAG TPA: adenylate synthase, partial [Flavobacteriales bacterium]|nr:adenylate synthase [Flavobacteriales bacterium]
MKRPFKLEVLWSWVLLTRSRRSFERDPDRHRSVMWVRFQNEVLSKSPKYRHNKGQALEAFSVQEKREFMRDFDQINTHGLTLDEAMEVAVQSEQSRDFAPTLNGVTVGLSSGTSGNRGLFLASEKERAMWVAAVLQRILGWSFRKRKVAFFLRANSNLYSSVQSKLIAFEFFDLLQPLDGHVTR